MPRYVALLRGINVGGNNVIRMADLRTCFEGAGFTDVTTYIQSGNVVFSHPGSASATVTKIDDALADAFSYQGAVAVRSRAQMRTVVGRAPKSFGADPKTFRATVAFLMPPLTPTRAMKDLPLREGIDRAWTGSGVLYFERLEARATQSALNKVASLPMYARMTIRNWNTTLKVLDLLER